MRRGSIRGVAALVAAVVALVAAGPAVAGDLVWKRIPCFSGAIDAVEVTEEGGSLLRVTGHLNCANPKADGSRFGYARYENDKSGRPGVLYDVNMRPYAAGARSLFSDGRYIPYEEVELAICVVTDYGVRIACVMVTREGWASPVVVAPLSTKDPIVARTLKIVPWISVERPLCGTCW